MKQRDVDVLEEDLVYDGFFQIKTFRLRHTLFAGGWSETIRRELFLRDPAVGVLLYDPWRDELVLVEQFRIGLLPSGQEPWIVELVAGIVEPGESVRAVGTREALEETGCPVDRLEPIADYFTSPGGSCERFHLFCGRVRAEGAGGIFGLPHEGEDIRALVLSFERAMALLAAREIDNAHTLIALQWLQSNRQRLREAWT